MRRPTSVHAWNVTNLKDVLDAGAKPQLDKVDAALTHVEEGSDLKWLDGGDAYEFTRRSTYVARDAKTRRVSSSKKHHVFVRSPVSSPKRAPRSVAGAPPKDARGDTECTTAPREGEALDAEEGVKS